MLELLWTDRPQLLLIKMIQRKKERMDERMNERKENNLVSMTFSVWHRQKQNTSMKMMIIHRFLVVVFLNRFLLFCAFDILRRKRNSRSATQTLFIFVIPSFTQSTIFLLCLKTLDIPLCQFYQTVWEKKTKQFSFSQSLNFFPSFSILFIIFLNKSIAWVILFFFCF